MPIRPLLACLLLALTLTACADEPESEALTVDPDAEGVTVPAEPEEIIEGADDLLDRWVITEQAGAAPEDLYFVTFTREGDYIVQSESGAAERSRFHLAGDNIIAVTDSTGTRHFAYEIDGATLTLSVPGTENVTVMERSDVNF